MIAFCSTVHPRNDTRVRIKEISSLAREFAQPVFFFVQDGKGDERDPHTGVTVIDTGPAPRSRWLRILAGVWRMYRTVLAARPAIVHFHDPELIPMGFLLKLSGIRVIYDVHEDVPLQILSKDWVPPTLRRPISKLIEGIEAVAGRAFDAVVVATPSIGLRFPRENTVLVQNFPLLDELVAASAQPYAERTANFAYVGVITVERGAREMVSALARDPAEGMRLVMAGEIYPSGLRAELEKLDGWQQVEFIGFANRTQVADLLGRARAGLVIFHAEPNHVEAQPNKMFEYMAAGLPVIVSDFPLWREIVDGAQCGLLVDPLDAGAIAAAMDWILRNPVDAEAMGRRGRQAVERTYNWVPEADRLIVCYRRLLRNTAPKRS